MDIWLDGQMDEGTNRLTDGLADTWSDKQMDGQIDRH